MSGQPQRLADARGKKVVERLRGQARVRYLGARARRVLLTRWDILALIAAGGSLGAAARYGIGQAMPRTSREFPWATFLINVTGSFAVGVLMVFVLEVWASSRYVRPFFGVGLLGGYTTFSTYALETRDLLVAGQKDLAGIYLLASLAAGLTSVWLGIVIGRVTLVVIGGVRRRRIRRRRAASPRPRRAQPNPADDVSPTPTTGSSR